MKNTNDIFTAMYPHLDIHGETYDTADLIIKEFINDNLKLKKETIVIIHGIGEGILKQKTHDVLKRHPLVLDYKININNVGSTVITLKIDKT